MTCLVSGGPDSTCLWHALRTLGYRVSALHVNHGLRGQESVEDARFCAEALGATVVEAPGAGLSEAGLRELRRRGRYSLSAAEGRFGISPTERDAGIMEEGTLLLFVSRWSS